MKASQFMPEVAARLTAHAPFSSFLPVLQEDSTTDFGPVIQEAIEENDVCLAVCDVESATTGESQAGSVFMMNTRLAVFVFQGVNSTAPLKGIVLIEEVIAAVTQHANQVQRQIRLEGFERITNEQGALLTIIEFSALTIT